MNLVRSKTHLVGLKSQRVIEGSREADGPL